MEKLSNLTDGDSDAASPEKVRAPRLLYITIAGPQGEGKSSIARSIVRSLCADAWHVILHDEDEQPQDFGAGSDMVHVFCIQKEVK